MPIAADERDEDPVPQWEQLPDYTRAELSACGCDAGWFSGRGADAVMRLTVLNLYVKLKGLDLWRFVGSERDSQAGCLHFVSADVGGLRGALGGRRDFTSPGEGGAWQSRERRAEGALHFKHFAGWSEEVVQAHIDPQGLLLGSHLWWLLPIVPLGQMLRHGADPEGYTDVHRIRAQLLGQGWDPAPLTGHS